MTDEEKSKAAELIARLDYCRTEDRHECALIHYRMIWMLSCQGFLLAGYFALSQGITNKRNSLLIAAICIISALIAWRVRIAIKQAEEVIDKIHNLERRVFDEARENKNLEAYFSGYNTDRNWGDSRKDIHQVLSFACQKEIPWGFVAIWAIFFVVSIGHEIIQ